MSSCVDRWHLPHKRTEQLDKLAFIEVGTSRQDLRGLQIAGSDLLQPFLDLLITGSGSAAGIADVLRKASTALRSLADEPVGLDSKQGRKIS